MNINSVNLTGNLTRDPETFSAGCTLGLAVNERVKENDEWTDRASFFDVVVFGKQADACAEYLSKGSPVAVSGRLRQDRWQNDSGDNRSKVKVVAFTVQFLGGKEDRQEREPEPVASGGVPDDDDQIPFARPPVPDFSERRRDVFARARWLA